MSRHGQEVSSADTGMSFSVVSMETFVVGKSLLATRLLTDVDLDDGQTRDGLVLPSSGRLGGQVSVQLVGVMEVTSSLDLLSQSSHGVCPGDVLPLHVSDQGLDLLIRSNPESETVFLAVYHPDRGIVHQTLLCKSSSH
jgi:hypothetical protein